MQTIKIPAPARMGAYVRHVIEHGHRPGVLSGAELRGRARHWAASYYHQRRRAEEYVAPYSVVRGIAMVGSRRCAVWMRDGVPAQCELDTAQA